MEWRPEWIGKRFEDITDQDKEPEETDEEPYNPDPGDTIDA